MSELAFEELCALFLRAFVESILFLGDFRALGELSGENDEECDAYAS